MADISNNEAKILKDVFLKMYNKYLDFCNKSVNGLEPNYITVPGTDNIIMLARFREMLKRWVAYRNAHNQERPNYVWIVKPKTNTIVTQAPIADSREMIEPTATGTYVSPRFLRWLDQETNYWCGPFMLLQLIYELYGKQVAQETLANLAGTTTSGSGHSGLEYAAEKAIQNLGHKADLVWQNFSGLASSSQGRWKKLGEMIADPKIGIGIHCQYKRKWGHYMVPVYVDLNKKTVGFIDSLNPEDIIYTTFAEAEVWIAMTYAGQPSVCKLIKIS